jgi:hypothetical protein
VELTVQLESGLWRCGNFNSRLGANEPCFLVLFLVTEIVLPVVRDKVHNQGQVRLTIIQLHMLTEQIRSRPEPSKCKRALALHTITITRESYLKTALFLSRNSI